MKRVLGLVIPVLSGAVGSFFHLIRMKPSTSRRIQRFVFVAVLALVISIIHRGREVSTRVEYDVPDKLIGQTIERHVPMLHTLSARNTTHADLTISFITNETHEQDNTLREDHTTFESDDKTNDDPCIGRTQPAPIPEHLTKPPSLYFLHIPKTAGTLMHHLAIRYASKTNGLACQYLYDGNRFGPSDYHLSVNPSPSFPNGSIEQQAVDAIHERNRARKLQLLKNGACRAMRGHVTYKQRDQMPQPVISLTVLRDPLERLVSMYEFALMMVKTRPGHSGWDNLISGNIEADFKNASSLLNKGFYDEDGEWVIDQNAGFSFHFYGVLHQLSGVNPTFEGVGIPEQFHISNADQLAEKAKDNICSTHILGTQGDMAATLDLFFNTLTPYSNWTDSEIKTAKSVSINKNRHNKTIVVDSWPDTMRAAMQRRFQHETDVYYFALKVIDYRKQIAEHR